MQDGRKRLRADGTIGLGEAVAAMEDGEDRIGLEDSTSRAASGAADGLLFRALVGLVFAVPVVGTISGVAAGRWPTPSR